MTKLRSFIDAFLRALSILVIVIIILIGSFLIYYFVSIKIYEKKGTDYKPPIAMYMIISKSMIPNINVYDVVVDQKVTNINNIKVNDVITFVSKSPMSYNYIVTHRVIDISKTSDGIALLTKGDNNKIADEALVYEEQILGKMIFKIPKLGKIQTFLAYKGGWVIIIILPAIGIITADIVKIAENKIKKHENKKKI